MLCESPIWSLHVSDAEDDGEPEELTPNQDVVEALMVLGLDVSGSDQN